MLRIFKSVHVQQLFKVRTSLQQMQIARFADLKSETVSAGRNLKDKVKDTVQNQENQEYVKQQYDEKKSAAGEAAQKFKDKVTDTVQNKENQEYVAQKRDDVKSAAASGVQKVKDKINDFKESREPDPQKNDDEQKSTIASAAQRLKEKVVGSKEDRDTEKPDEQKSTIASAAQRLKEKVVGSKEDRDTEKTDEQKSTIASAAQRLKEKVVGSKEDRDTEKPDEQKSTIASTSQKLKEKVTGSTENKQKQQFSTQQYEQQRAGQEREDLENVTLEHREPQNIRDRLACSSIKLVKSLINLVSGQSRPFPWQSKELSEKIWLRKTIMLETIAGTPYFAAAIIRYWRSVGSLKEDNDWIQKLLADSENERMHIQHWLYIRQPNLLFRSTLLLMQAIYVPLFTLQYILMPRTTHRRVAYFEEEAVRHYSLMLNEIQRKGSPLEHWKTQRAPETSIQYWHLDKNATVFDAVLSIRKDEVNQVEEYHQLAENYSKVKNENFPQHH